MRKSFSPIYLLLLCTMQASSLMDHLKHNDQLQLQRGFRQYHNLSLFIKPWPIIPNVDTNSANITAFPTLHIWQNKPIQSFGVRAVGEMKILSFMAEPVVVNDSYGPDLLGTDYVRSGISGRITNAFIRYESDLMSLQLGRSPVWWGQSWNHSIIQTGSTPAYDHMDLRLNFGRFQLEMLSGQLGSELLNGKRIKRNIAGHRLTWISKDGKLLAGFGEQIIYTGQNRTIEWHYLNPVVPYFFSGLEGDEESSDESDNDNSIVFATIRYVPKPNLSFFSELIVDDFQVDNNNLQDGLGYKIGADGAFNISGNPITWVLEWTSINSWTYIHHGQFTSWQNRGHAIGYPYGPDLRSLYVQAEMWLNKFLLINLEADWMEKGFNTLSTEWANSDNRNDPFPILPITRHTLFVTSLSWYWERGIVEAGWSNYPFPNEIAFSDPHSETEGNFFLKAQLFYDFWFDLN